VYQLRLAGAHLRGEPLPELHRKFGFNCSGMTCCLLSVASNPSRKPVGALFYSLTCEKLSFSHTKYLPDAFEYELRLQHLDSSKTYINTVLRRIVLGASSHLVICELFKEHELEVILECHVHVHVHVQVHVCVRDHIRVHVLVSVSVNVNVSVRSC
jgi:hypothetical protein